MSTKDTRSYRLLSNVNPLIFFIPITWDEVLCYVSHAFTLFLCHPFCCLPWTSSTSASPPCPLSDPTSNPPSLPQKLSVLQIYSFLTPLPFCIYVVRFLELIKGRVLQFFPLTTGKRVKQSIIERNIERIKMKLYIWQFSLIKLSYRKIAIWF